MTCRISWSHAPAVGTARIWHMLNIVQMTTRTASPSVAVETRRRALLLAARTMLDVRTCRRAIERGVRALKSELDRELVTQAAKEIGIELPEGGGG